MSRSYRKTTIFGNSFSESEKDAKKTWHRMYRRKIKNNLNIHIKMDTLDNMVKIYPEDVFNVYLLPKDGKHYWSKSNMEIRIEQGLVDKEYIRKLMSK